MLISCNRLKKYINASDEINWLSIWDKFTVRVAEVEGVKKVGNSFDGVVVAEIVKCEEHPNSDHMHILQVDIGLENPVQVVCGAPNVREGLKTAFVKVGGHIDGVEITARPLRGVESNGMCCSGKELSISDNHEGILELPSSWANGTDIKELLPIEDIIVEIDNKSLTNRPDLWGHYGIAREISALTGHQLLPLELESIKNDKEDLKITINNPELCRRYCGLTIDNIKNNQTPLEMQIFLYYAGMRSISLLVDLTNFIMLELGQPMHAFDKRIVKSIEVGLANDQDKFTTLDGVERVLNKDNLMIKNEDEYFCIAGVMGGLDSEILPDTTSIFLESANFDAGSVRKTAVYHGLRTEASARYEKSLDPNMNDVAIKRFVYLLKIENPELEISSNLTDVYVNKLSECEIKLEKCLLKTYMGFELPDKEVCSILESLGFKVKESKEAYIVKVPTFRHSKDINIPEDLIEEIARIYGFENLTPEPLKLDLISKNLDPVYDEEYVVKRILAEKFNAHEVHSYLWYNSSLLKELNINKEGVKLLGKSEDNILRDDLGFSLLNIVKENIKNISSFKIFEIGTTIKSNDNNRNLAIVLVDDEKNIANIYNEAKSIVSYLFKMHKNVEATIVQGSPNYDYYDNNLCKDILLNGQTFGKINVLNKLISSKIGKKKSIVLINIDFDKYINIEKQISNIDVVSKYPTVELDYTIILDKNMKYDYLKKILMSFQSKLIKSFKLVDIYENKYTIRYVLGSNNKTLETEDLQKFKERFIAYVKDNQLNIVE